MSGVCLQGRGASGPLTGDTLRGCSKEGIRMH